MGRLSPASPNYPWTCVARSMQLHGSQLPKGQTGAEKNEKGGFRAALFYAAFALPPFSFRAQRSVRCQLLRDQQRLELAAQPHRRGAELLQGARCAAVR